MKKISFLLLLSILIVACNNKTKESATPVDSQEIAMNYQSFGDKISDEKVLSKEEIKEKFSTLKSGDTVPVKFTTKVLEVCQSKGCWMRMDMDQEEAMVKFKDYAFFMPKDIAGKEIIVEGVAFVQEMSVDEQRHYAEDAGKSADEVAAITEPKRTLSVLSNGVLIPEE